MAISGIPGARKKLARAKFHAEALRAEVQAFKDQDPYDFEMKSLGNARGESDFRVLVKVAEGAPAVPESWALTAGDVLTNARAALDHAVYPHVSATAPSVARWKIQHPIVDTEAAFEVKAGWFADGVRQIVEDSQPYKASDPLGHPFRALRELVNIDKHRDLVLVNYATDELEIMPDDMFELVSPPTVFKQRVMESGTVVARAHLRFVRNVVGDQVMNFGYNIAFGDSIEIPGIDRPVGLVQAVECIVDAIGPHLDNLEAAGC